MTGTREPCLDEASKPLRASRWVEILALSTQTVLRRPAPCEARDVCSFGVSLEDTDRPKMSQ